MTSKLTRERIELIANFHRAMTLPPSHDEIEELARMALAAMDGEPVAWRRFQETPTDGGYWILYDYKPTCSGVEPLYRHAQQPVVPKSISVRQAISALESASAVTTIGQAYKMGWNACRAAMLQELKKSAGAGAVCRSSDNAQVLTSINPAPTLVSLPKNAKSLTGNSPVIGIDLASGPDRTVEVHYVVPPGYVVVPKEPTEAMINAWLSEVANWRGHVAGYKAMLAAAPQPQNAPQNIPEIIPGWIPVSERMPDENADQQVLACFKGGDISALYYSDGRWDDAYGIVPIRQDVTHWMPLPAAPQEGK